MPRACPLRHPACGGLGPSGTGRRFAGIGYTVRMREPSDRSVDLDAARQVLLEQRAEMVERVTGLAAPPELGAAQGFGKRIGDGTVEAISRLTDIGVGDSLEVRLARVERALAKLEAGTYGVCDACGEPIARPRLEAMPESVLCIRCAGTQRRRAPRRR